MDSGVAAGSLSLSDPDGACCALDESFVTVALSFVQPMTSSTALRTAHLVIIVGIMVVVIVKIPRWV
jgi:hypothetical protein